MRASEYHERDEHRRRQHLGNIRKCYEDIELLGLIVSKQRKRPIDPEIAPNHRDRKQPSVGLQECGISTASTDGSRLDANVRESRDGRS